MTWQPPIPAGALYSKPARELGPALPLLAYCYELIQRNGTATVLLKDIAEIMEEPYPNIKHWWQKIRQGPWFTEVCDRGRKGYFVTFNSDWIDWRILSTRREAPTLKDISRTNEGAEVILEDVEEHLKDISRTNEGAEVILEPRMYKVLHDYQNTSSSSVTARVEKPAQPNREMVMMMFEEFGFKSAKAVNEIALMNLDQETVATSIRNLLASGYTHGAIIERLRLTPPIRGEPYPATRSDTFRPPKKKDPRVEAAYKKALERSLPQSNTS